MSQVLSTSIRATNQKNIETAGSENHVISAPQLWLTGIKHFLSDYIDDLSVELLLHDHTTGLVNYPVCVIHPDLLFLVNLILLV